MSTSDLLGTTPTDDDRTDAARRLHRIAGLGGVGAVLAWVCQPILVSVMAASDAPDAPAWSDIEAMRWNGSIEVLVFSGMGLGILFFVLGTWGLIRLRGGEASVAQQVGLAGGVLGAVAWFVVAAESFRIYTSIGAGLPEVTDDVELQRVALDGTYLDITGAIILFAVGFTLWSVLLVTTARRVGAIGTPLAVVVGLSLLGPVAGLALPFGSPWWLMGYVLSLLVIGCTFLVKSRR